MLREEVQLIKKIQMAVDLSVISAAFFFAYFLRDRIPLFPVKGLFPLWKYQWVLLLAVVFWWIALNRFHVNVSQRTKGYLSQAPLLLKSGLFVSLGIFSIVFLMKWQYISRSFLLIFSVLAPFLLILEKEMVRLVLRWIRGRGRNFRRILVVGTGKRARDIINTVEKNKEWGLRIAGLIEMDVKNVAGDSIYGYPVLGTRKDIRDIFHNLIIDEVIIAVPAGDLEKIEDILKLCKIEGIKARVMVNFFDFEVGKMEVEAIEEIPLLTFSKTPPLSWALFAKYTFDKIFSLLVLLLLSPLLLMISILIKVTSPGPVYFKQKRVGLGGRQFSLYKFRSMVVDAERKKSELASQNEMDGPVFKIKKDPRVTSIGKFLRKFSLDELPQLYNVWRGDMSLIGPRPPVPKEVEEYEDWQRRKLSMKPGITCLWQVSGRNAIGFEEWMKLDLQYIDHWSLWLDIKILFKTIPVVFFGRGAS